MGTTLWKWHLTLSWHAEHYTEMTDYQYIDVKVVPFSNAPLGGGCSFFFVFYFFWGGDLPLQFNVYTLPACTLKLNITL